MDEQRIRWLCRRGMKELDVMLARYLESRWPDAAAPERAAFAALLELQDPVLYDVLLGRGIMDDDAQADVIERIRALSGV